MRLFVLLCASVLCCLFGGLLLLRYLSVSVSLYCVCLMLSVLRVRVCLLLCWLRLFVVWLVVVGGVLCFWLF